MESHPETVAEFKVSLCPPNTSSGLLAEQEALELEKRHLQFTVWAGDLQAASLTVNTSEYTQ